MEKQIHIFGGGTFVHVRSHLSLAAYSAGTTARQLCDTLAAISTDHVQLHLTAMAGGNGMVTNDDVAARLQQVLARPETRAIIFNVALCDVAGHIGDVPSGKYAERLQSRELPVQMTLTAAPKLLATIKEQRPDVYLVGFKTTTHEPREVQIAKARRQIAEAKVDLVLANDTGTRHDILLDATGSVVYEGDRAVALDLLTQAVAGA